ncbi:MAG: S8 family serine peptidase, partial [Acidobacteria bacterium]|nr:S8 family serine peptidase [Acidobacteriota bacterium]
MGTKPGSAAPSAASQQPPNKGNIKTGADAVTLAVRDAGNQLIRVTIRNEEDREAVRGLGTVVEDYGTFVVVAINRAMAHGKAFEQADKIETGIHLPGFSFDPLTESAERAFAGISGMVKPTGDGADYYIVQFAAPARDEWLAELRAAGAEILQYVPHQAFFVYASREAMATIENHPRVRWTGAFHPLYKLSPQMRQLALTQSATGSNVGQFDIAVFKQVSLEATATTVSDFGGRIKYRIVLPGNYFNVIRVEMDAGLILPMVQIPGVITIDPYIPPEKEDERAAQIVAGNFTNNTTISGPGYDSLTQFGVDGTNVTVAVVDDGVGIPGDGGFYITSSNTVNAPLRGAAAGADGHGHLNATIIAGDLPFSSLLDPTGHNYGLGVARKSHIINVPLLRSGYTGSEADTCNDTVTTSGPNGVKGTISNNSWGAGLNGNSYDSFAAQYDGFVRDSSSAATIDPLLIVFSAGNQGTNGLTRPKVAKNVIATANSENLRPELTSSANNLDDLASSSSRGPAADGRIKPDITAPGTGVSGGRSGTDTLFGNIDAHHRWSTGTSHAAPQIAGAAALFTQFWKNANGGTNPSPALVKAAILNGGQEMSGTNVTASIPNGAEGWGRLNLKNVLNTGVATKYVNQTNGLTNIGQEFTYNGTIATNARHFRATLVWTDPPGVSNPALVNNLDLEVTVGATTYKGNVFSGGLSASGGSADTINNVENVWLAAGVTAGTAVTVRIRATGLNGDGILGDADTTDQHFALVVFNFSEAPICNYTLNPSNANYSSAGGNGSVTVTTDVACNWSASSNNSWIQIGGTPGGPGNGSVNYSVSANNGPARNGSMTIAGLSFPVTQASGCTAITVNPGTLPNGDVGISYSQTLMVAGGMPGYALSVSGTLPNGISLVGTALTGTPTAAGTFAFTIQATDSLGCTGSQSYSVTINNHLQFYPLPRPIR